MNVLMFSQDPAVLVDGSPARRRMEAYAEALGALHVIVRSGAGGRMQITRSLILYPASPRGILGLIRAWHTARMIMLRIRFDVISVQAPDLWGCMAWLLSHYFRIPLELQLHTDYMSPRYRRASGKEYCIFMMARFLIPRAACVRVVSARIKASLIESRIMNHESRVAVLPIFTDVSRFLAASADAETERRFTHYDFKMVAAGRFMEKEKNFLMLIGMMRELVKTHPKTLLMIVGDGPDGDRYKLQTTNYKLEKNIIIEPWRDDLPSLFKSFDLFVLSSNYEGWGRVVIEAMAAGLPVVMTDVGLAGEIVRDGKNGLVVPVGDRQAMLRAVRACYESAEKRKMFARAGRETAKNLRPATWQEYLDRYRVCLASCMRNAGELDN